MLWTRGLFGNDKSSTDTGLEDLGSLQLATSLSRERGTAVQPCSSTVLDMLMFEREGSVSGSRYVWNM